ncbi:MAG: ISAzo13 family transposase [Euzebya sp.]
MPTDAEVIAEKYGAISPFLDERQRRLWLAVEAGALGHGGVSLVARAAGVSRTTVTRAVGELAMPPQEGEGLPTGRVRRPGAGRKAAEVADPGVVEALEKLVAPATRGDPMSPLRWTSKSTRTLARELTAARSRGISAWTVAKLLRKAGYRLQANAKTREGRQHPDRDAQFVYLADRVSGFLAAGDPVISVDTKKKELVGNFANKGREWQPSGEPEDVSVHDFKDPELGRANPYGVYDVGADAGWVSVGTDHDTAAFAVESIRRWWARMGQPTYPDATRLLITADGGGSNGSRCRLWKVELARLAADTGLEVTVCHLPPATSKWNKIEHRMFSHISMNWRGRPLTSHEVIIETIKATTTTSGLTIDADLDDGVYPKGIKISDAEMRALPLTLHDFHGEWNYTLSSHQTTTM